MSQCELCRRRKPKSRDRYKCGYHKKIMTPYNNPFFEGKENCPGFELIDKVSFVGSINNLFTMLSTHLSFLYELQKIFGPFTGVKTDGMRKPKTIEIHWHSQATLVIFIRPHWNWLGMQLIEPEDPDDELVSKLMDAKKILGQGADARGMERVDGQDPTPF